MTSDASSDLPNPTEQRIVGAFADLDRRLGLAGVAVLSTRLRAELLGDADAVADTLTADFEVTMHSGPATVTLPAAAVLEGIRAQHGAGVLMWAEFDVLLSDAETVACTGRLCTLTATAPTLTATPVALTFRVRDGRMCSEEVYLAGEPTVTTPADSATVSAERVRALLDGQRTSARMT